LSFNKKWGEKKKGESATWPMKTKRTKLCAGARAQKMVKFLVKKGGWQASLLFEGVQLNLTDLTPGKCTRGEGKSTLGKKGGVTG